MEMLAKTLDLGHSEDEVSGLVPGWGLFRWLLLFDKIVTCEVGLDWHSDGLLGRHDHRLREVRQLLGLEVAARSLLFFGSFLFLAEKIKSLQPAFFRDEIKCNRHCHFSIALFSPGLFMQPLEVWHLSRFKLLHGRHRWCGLPLPESRCQVEL